jgi:hypothetical protein
MNCETVRKQTSLFLYGELSLEDEQIFQDHMEACEACRREFEAVRRLHRALDTHQVEPHPALLERCRRDLAAHLPSSPVRPRGLRHWFARISDMRIAVLARPVGALALVALGFFAARWTSVPAAAPRLASGGEAAVTRVRYVTPGPSGNVQVQVEETRQRTVSGSPEDDQIRRLLMAAARESSDPGLRAESMDLLKTRQPRNELRPVLLYALQHDPNPGVRLKALDALKTDAARRDVREALSSVLLADDNPGVRAQAIDLLVQHKQESTVPVCQEIVQKEDNAYVRQRCQRALEEMNASIGTF